MSTQSGKAALTSLEGKAAEQTADAREKAEQILANLGTAPDHAHGGASIA
ncbi:hypothetical protein [Rhizobium mesoamericanum]|nr:hypothetical protein [Rhizobium mesoamericanum]